ncbi:MAG: hypothetical protein KatS3mg011_1045 [Acidimicrobiia bacterium]|nr:MAG: hypothetical protein KatS3mg011_1045 [Acidimicrobiia bacterium]
MGLVVYNHVFGALALAAWLFTAAGLVPGVRRIVAGAVSPRGLTTAIAVVATVATLGSLGYSEVWGFEPCRLCWYQRIAMYPIAVSALAAAAAPLTGTAVRTARRMVLSLAIPGALIAAWHWIGVQVLLLGEGVCTLGVPCSARYVEVFGFLTIPAMALAGFCLITVLAGMLTERTNE